MKSLLILALIAISFSGFGQTNATGKKRRILLENAKVHTGNGFVYEKGTIGIEGDRIILVRNSLAYSYNANEWDTIIDLTGQQLYPGFVAPNSTLGLTEIDAVRSTRDFAETGIYNPNVRSLIAYNCESNILATVRTNGVLLTQSTPRGGVIPGSSSVMRTDCWNWEDGVAMEDDGIHLNWPASLEGGGWWAEPAAKRRNENYANQKREIVSFFEQAKAYLEGKDQAADLRFEAMRACFKGQKRIYFHADELQQILDIVDFVKNYGIAYPVIIGGYDSPLAARQLVEAKIPVMLRRVHSLPEMEDHPVDLPYRLPAMLQAAGIKFCLQNEGDMEAMNARNLPFLAGTAMAYGLTEEEAIRSVSLSPCEIMGIEKNYGSIEEGKKATLFASTGNALDMRTNNLTLILVDGTFSSTKNFQTELYLKYKKKYGL